MQRDECPDTLRILLGEQALSALVDPDFLARWRRLAECAEDATIFQSVEFASAWYASYGQSWQPLIVVEYGTDGALDGVWALAQHRHTGELVGAGAHQAEYQAPLVLRSRFSAFLARAWQALSELPGVSSLRLRYVPSVAILPSLRADAWLARRLQWRVCSRPLMRLDADTLRQAMDSKRRKTRFNRLKRLGNYEFRRVTDMAELESIMGILTSFYDIRQGAINQSTPFHDDPVKHEFHRALFACGAPASYVTVSYLDGEPIAAFWGMASGNTAHLCMVVHSPMLAEHSLGKVHLLQLGLQLLDDGMSTLDLTPGGDRWKEEFANDHDEVLEIQLFSQPWRLRWHAMQVWTESTARSAVQLLGLQPAKLRELGARARRITPGALLRRLAHWIGFERELRVYSIDSGSGAERSRTTEIHCNCLADLLQFEPGESWQSRDAFLSSALYRIEHGERVYTVMIDGRLAHYGWLVPGQTECMLSEVEQRLTLPPSSATLYDFYTLPEYRGRGLYRRNLDHMLAETFADGRTSSAYIAALADNLPSRRTIEKAGFAYRGSMRWSRRFGRDAKSRSSELGDGEVGNAKP